MPVELGINLKCIQKIKGCSNIPYVVRNGLDCNNNFIIKNYLKIINDLNAIPLD